MGAGATESDNQVSIDYSQLPLSKGTPAKMEKAARDRQRQSIDEAENEKVKARSGGQCEIVTTGRCRRRAVHVHHLLGGFGVRGRGESAKASNKLHVCQICHSDIHGHVLLQLASGKAWRRLR